MKRVVRGVEARMYSEVQCVHPVRVKTRTGKNIIVGCGCCVLCLKRRRETWSKRLIDESKHPLCIHQFGFTLTYDSQHVPFLFRSELDQQQYDYEMPNSSHTYLNVRRGVSPRLLADGIAVGLLSSRDIDLFIKKFRKSVEKDFPYLHIRYFIAGEYGEHDEFDKVFRRTARPHYHGIIFVYLKDLNSDVRSNSQIMNFLAISIEKKCLACWEHCQSFYSAKKDMIVGKSIQKFGENWGSYLGKYINKETTGLFKGCKGSNWIPERIWVSRSSKKFGLGSIGLSSLKQNEKLAYLQELDYCIKHKSRFEPTYNENGFTKALSKPYRNMLYEEYFGIKMSRVYQYISRQNYIEEHKHLIDYDKLSYPMTFKSIYEDSDDPFFPLKTTTDTAIVAGIPSKWYKRVNPDRKINSIATAPRREPGEYLEEVTCLPYFSRQETERIERYLDFRDVQTDLWYSSYCDTGVYSHQLLLDIDTELFQACTRITDPNWFRGLNDTRKNTLCKADDVLEKALQQKHYHELKNGYTVS